MTIAILATGDEIIHGDTLNTNGHEIAHALSSEGLPLGMQLACSDKKIDIINGLRFLTKQHDIIILIGGLGPTTDDLTRFALAEFTGDTLVQHQEALTHIQQRLQAAKVMINQGNLQQALFPEQATLIPNPHGSAMGCYYPWNHKILILLPGPPRECLPMFNQHILPLLQKTQHSTKEILKWRIFGLAESEIAQTLEEALAGLPCQTGYRLDTPYIEFKIKCSSDLIPQIKAIIDPLLAPHIISKTHNKASEALIEYLLYLNQPITIIDEATGGLLQFLITKPETYELLHFNTSNNNALSFHISGLNEYWSQQSASQTQLSIHYNSDKLQGSEKHLIPYRNSSLVLVHAAEWLSSRLFHLINQLHEGIT